MEILSKLAMRRRPFKEMQLGCVSRQQRTLPAIRAELDDIAVQVDVEFTPLRACIPADKLLIPCTSEKIFARRADVLACARNEGDIRLRDQGTHLQPQPVR